MRSKLCWLLSGVGALLLTSGTPVAADNFRGFLISPAICERANLSGETQAWCDSIVGLRGYDLYKATVLENLRRRNRAPTAHLELAPDTPLPQPSVLPDRVDLDASGSHDPDGRLVLYTFRLFDGEGGLLAGPLETPSSIATLRVFRELPETFHASVLVEDDHN